MILNNCKTKKLISILIIPIILAACGVMKNDSIASPTANPTETVLSIPTQAPAQDATPVPTLVPTPVPTAEPTAPPTPLELIHRRISTMSDTELIGQMVMIGFTGTKDMDIKSIELMRDYSVGSVILFGWNTIRFSQTKELIEKINGYNNGGIPLLIGIDVEGGGVTRFKGQWRPFINSALVLGKANDPERVYKQYKRIGEQLKEIGFNINFAPVLDIAHDPNATFLGSRMFGSDPERVSVLIREAIKGLHDGGIASMGKHFPGHGGTTLDSHKTLPVIDASLEEMDEYALIPFQAAIDEGVDAIMVAHLSYPHLDSQYITSVSPSVITGILRDRMGFEGVVVSDDMRMQGLRGHYSVGEGAVLHILAGGDMVLIGKYSDLQAEVLESLNQAVKEGRITRERLEESVLRILEMKQEYIDFLQ